MSDFKHNPGFGSLFKNSKKEQGDSKPNATGSIATPDGKVWDLAAWTKQDKNGNLYQSLKVSEPYKKEGGEKQAEPPKAEDPNDDIPF